MKNIFIFVICLCNEQKSYEEITNLVVGGDLSAAKLMHGIRLWQFTIER
jgi:hypothetical protein